jgi:hypothetical protein
LKKVSWVGYGEKYEHQSLISEHEFIVSQGVYSDYDENDDDEKMKKFHSRGLFVSEPIVITWMVEGRKKIKNLNLDPEYTQEMV